MSKSMDKRVSKLNEYTKGDIMSKLWIADKMYIVDSAVREYIEKLTDALVDIQDVAEEALKEANK